MPLSNVEREVLDLIFDEHRQTRRGAKALIVHAGMNAKTGEQKARVTDVLHALKKRGLVMLMDGTWWIPTGKGVEEIAIDPADLDPYHFAHDELPIASIERIGAPLPDDLINRCAAMNAALLAQAESAHAAGDADAWRDLAWLMETGRQLVAVGGEV